MLRNLQKWGGIALQYIASISFQDPWTATTRTTPFSLSFGGNVRPLRAAYTGDDYLRRKHGMWSRNMPLP